MSPKLPDEDVLTKHFFVPGFKIEFRPIGFPPPPPEKGWRKGLLSKALGIRAFEEGEERTLVSRADPVFSSSHSTSYRVW